jgi:hypothetical protein
MTAPILIRKRIRLKVESDKWTNSVDILASATPRMYRGNDCQFEIGIFWNSALIDASNIASLTLSIWTSDRKTRKATKTITAGDITADPSAAGWAAGTAQHATIPFSGTEMNWALSGTLTEENFFLVVAGITNDSPGHEITYGVSVFTLVEDAEGVAGAPPVNDPRYYTQDEADARFVPLGGDQYSFRVRSDPDRNVKFLEFYTQEDGKWHAAIPKLQDGLLTFTPGASG